MSNPKLVILISGRGSNMKAILEASKKGILNADVVAVLSNKPNAQGLVYAKAEGITTEVVDQTQFSSKEEYEDALKKCLLSYNPDLIVLAGYMRILGGEIISTFESKILNIHPSLLPEFKGLNAQKQALEAGVKEAGCTVHVVDTTLDGGPILAQEKVPVLEGDTVESLSLRILEREHSLYPNTIQNYLTKAIKE